jgi:predicted nuclease with RNAse H fold
VAWSTNGDRECDKRLRLKYPEIRKTIVHQNSLRSTMTINGAIVAIQTKIPVIECHPGVLKAMKIKSNTRDLISTVKRGHEQDALIAAWAASQWHYKKWTVDLFGKHPAEAAGG